MDESLAQTPLNFPVTFQVFNTGFVSPYASSQSSSDCVSSTFQTSNNVIVPGPATSQSAGDTFATAWPTSQGLVTSDYFQQPPIVSDIAVPDPSIKLFAYSLSIGLSSLDVLKPYSNFELYKPHAIFLLISNYVLSRAKIDYPQLAEVVAKSGDEVGAVSSALFFNTLGVIVAKFFFSKGLLTIYNAFSLSQTALNLIKIYAEYQGVFDIESMMIAIANGLYDFVNSYGLINRSNLSQIYHSFAEVIKDLSTGVAI